MLYCSLDQLSEDSSEDYFQSGRKKRRSFHKIHSNLNTLLKSNSQNTPLYTKKEQDSLRVDIRLIKDMIQYIDEIQQDIKDLQINLDRIKAAMKTKFSVVERTIFKQHTVNGSTNEQEEVKEGLRMPGDCLSMIKEYASEEDDSSDSLVIIYARK